MGNESGVLQEKRVWQEVGVVGPPKPLENVVMRIYKDGEEDVIIGHINQNGVWEVSAPFPLYDITELTSSDQLSEGVEVTHWAVPEDGEIEKWWKRFEPTGCCGTPGLYVDKAYKELVYRALTWGMGYIKTFAKPNSVEEAKFLETCIDVIYDVRNSIKEFPDTIGLRVDTILSNAVISPSSNTGDFIEGRIK